MNQWIEWNYGWNYEWIEWIEWIESNGIDELNLSY